MARKSLEQFKSTKGKASARLPPAVSAPDESTKGQTLRLNMAAWRELKVLAIEQGKPAHTLLVESVNDLFRKYGKEPLA